jgi:hypothetical protein
MDGERLAQFHCLGIGIEPQSVSHGGSHRFQRERRRAERAFVRVELHQIWDARLLAGQIGRKLTQSALLENALALRRSANPFFGKPVEFLFRGFVQPVPEVRHVPTCVIKAIFLGLGKHRQVEQPDRLYC